MGSRRESSSDFLRQQTAQLAARYMIEHGIQSYALAKRKAARQLGLKSARHVPSNEEIDAAVLARQALFNGQTHTLNLQKLRRRALAAMRSLEPFNPHLTGHVLKGTAGPYSDIHIQVFSDNPKEIEHFILKLNWSYRHTTCSLGSASRDSKALACMMIEQGGPSIRLDVLPPSQLRNMPQCAGTTDSRANLSKVRALLDEL
jgi:hypothetical protein